MRPLRIVGVVLVVLGILGLALGQFTYTKDSDSADLGPIELEVRDRETVSIPTWAGVAAILVGGVLLLGSARRTP